MIMQNYHAPNNNGNHDYDGDNNVRQILLPFGDGSYVKSNHITA
jgi:hypothetical protein